MAFVEELYASRTVNEDSLGAFAVQLFRVDGTPDTAGSVISGQNSQGQLVQVPQRGDPYLPNPGLDMACSNRAVSRYTPDQSLVRCEFRRSSWQDVDPIAQGSVVARVQSSAEFVQVARIHAKTIDGPNGQSVAWNFPVEPIPRQTDTITATVRRTAWSKNESLIVTAEEGRIHPELTINTIGSAPEFREQYALAIFIGADIEHRGKNDWRVTYRWKRQGLLEEQGQISVDPDGQGGVFDRILPLTNSNDNSIPDQFGVSLPPGTFYPHTVPAIYRRSVSSALAPGLAVPEVLDPIYYESPYRNSFSQSSLTVLPGLEGGLSI